MTVVSPYAAVNTDHIYAERLNVNDIVIVCEQTAAASVSDQLQTIHVGINGESRRGKHLLQALVNDPRICALFRKRQTSVQ